MSSSLPAESPASDDFVCDCSKEWMRSACKGLSFFKAYNGKRYCVLHYPDKDKSTAFAEALKVKLDAQDFDFNGVWFPDHLNFKDFTFGEKTYFLYATFSAGANFSNATFPALTTFSQATFSGVANFFSVKFESAVYFSYTTFGERVNFTHATFGALAHFGAKFSRTVDFSFATFKDYVRFIRDRPSEGFDSDSKLILNSAIIEKHERVSFHTLTLRPHWFVNVDARTFEFINVNWDWRDISIKKEIESIAKADALSAHRLLAIACRNLAVNAEENHRYEEASRFRYMAMEARRLERWRGFAFWTLGWWYWLASGYGERVWRAFVVLVGVWLLAAALYTRVGFVRWEPRLSSEQEAAQAKRDEVGQPLRGWRPLTYSLGVMTLQKPEPHPATDAAQAVVMLETILGPVQAALLALAIRRKFMR